MDRSQCPATHEERTGGRFWSACWLLTLITALLVGCQVRTQPPTPATSTPVPATATPVPPTATPEPTATPTPLSAEVILQAAFNAVQEATSYRFDMDMLMTLSGKDIVQELVIPMRFGGDVTPPDRMQGTMTITVDDAEVETQVVVIGQESYVLDPLTGKWRLGAEDATMFDPEELVLDPADIEGLELLGEEIVDDTPVYHLTGRALLPFTFEEPLGEVKADMLVDYWIGLEDLRSVRSTVEGEIEFTGEIEATAAISMTMRTFDYDAAIEIVAPEVEIPPTPEPPRSSLLPAQAADDAQTHLELGLRSFEDDRLGLAAAHFSRAIELQPDLIDAYLYRGIALALMNELSRNADFDRVIMDRPDDPEAYVLRALHPTWGVDEGAGSDPCSDAASALELRPSSEEAKVIQGRCLCIDPDAGEDRAARAFELFAEARALDAAAVDPFYADASLDCFSSLYRQEEVGQIEQVLASLDADIADNPDLPGGYFVRAQAILWLRDYTIEETIDAWIDIFHYLKRANCPLGSQMRYGFDRGNHLAADREYQRYVNCITVDNVFDDIWEDEIDLSRVDALIAEDPQFKAKFEEFRRVAQEFSTQIVLPQQLSSVAQASLTSDDNAVHTLGKDSDVLQAWSLDGQPLGAFVFEEYVRTAAFSPDGLLLATSGDDGMVRLWDVAALSAGKDPKTLQEHEIPEGWVDAVAFSADGGRVAAVDDNAQAHIWSVETGEELEAVQVNEDVESIALFTARPWIATAWGNQATILNAETGGELAVLGEPCEEEFGCVGSSLHFVAVSPDETLVATAGRGNPDVKLWDAATGGLVRTLSGSPEGGGPMAFSSDGRLLLTGGNDGVARLWNLDSGALLRLMGHRSSSPPTSFGWQVWSVAFSADGKRILTAGADGTARLWDANTGQELATIFVTLPEMTE